jgi:hydrogenase maturation protease
MPPRILIAGIGNIFLGDDAFGVEVVHRLAARPLPAGVRVVDFGIRGFDLTFALLEEDDVVILVDAAPRGEPPGTLSVLEPEWTDPDDSAPGELLIDPHAMDPVKVLRLVRALGGRAMRVLLVGCEPVPLGTSDDEDMAPGLSQPVLAAVDQAVMLIESLVTEIHQGREAEVAYHE